ncbi:MAG: hypothetical protein ACM3N6_01070 [Betaproteobacteria bacterium]
MLSNLYVLTLAGVGVAVLALIWDAVISVSRKAPWEATRPDLSVVATQERRAQDLPFVGRDRRGADADSAEGEAQDERRVA